MSPLVSVGIPAYNRPDSLERAVRSVLAQDHHDLEIVVSDDASSDPEVAAVGRRLAGEDHRVRFTTRERNLGHAANYRWVLEAATGEWFMWLSDDDWIDAGYISRCLRALRADPSARLVCGQAWYEQDGDVVEERPIDLLSDRPAARIVRYFARVNMNGPLFGVARREVLVRTPFHEAPGGDWMLVSALAARGRIHTLRDVHVHRSTSGLGADPDRLGRSFGLRGPLARHHHLWTAQRLWREIVRREPAYRVMSLPARVLTASVAALLVVLRFPVVDLLRAAGLGPLERRAIAWVRARDRATSAP